MQFDGGIIGRFFSQDEMLESEDGQQLAAEENPPQQKEDWEDAIAATFDEDDGGKSETVSEQGLENKFGMPVVSGEDSPYVRDDVQDNTSADINQDQIEIQKNQDGIENRQADFFGEAFSERTAFENETPNIDALLERSGDEIPGGTETDEINDGQNMPVSSDMNEDGIIDRMFSTIGGVDLQGENDAFTDSLPQADEWKGVSDSLQDTGTLRSESEADPPVADPMEGSFFENDMGSGVGYEQNAFDFLPELDQALPQQSNISGFGTEDLSLQVQPDISFSDANADLSELQTSNSGAWDMDADSADYASDPFDIYDAAENMDFSGAAPDNSQFDDDDYCWQQ